MLRKMPFVLIIIIAAIAFLGPWIPPFFQTIFYATSLSLKSVIVFLLPVVIFGLLFKAAVDLAKKATGIILLILVGVCVSNFVSAFLSHYVGSWAYQMDLSLVVPKGAEMHGLKPAWFFELPKWIGNEKAMFGGILLGILMALWKGNLAHRLAVKLEWGVVRILKLFTYLIPLFITGFMIKLQADGVMQVIIRDYTFIFALIAVALFGYIFLAYFILDHFKMGRFLNSIKNMLPAAMSGVTTMSSAASMPLTLIGTESNTQNKDIAHSVIPATVNVHLIGDCFAIPIFAYAVLKNYGMPEPTLMAYLYFAFYFVIAKFSVAAVPGGGILVMLPVLSTYLGFHDEMLSLITALYILFDPVITCANVLGNGAFAKMIDRVVSFSTKR